MNKAPEFTESEMAAVQSTLRERYGSPPRFEFAEAELRLDAHASELTVCPALYWKVDDCHFIITKTGEKGFRCQFFYSVSEEYGTGVKEYDDILDCVVSLLRVQADHDVKRKRAREA